MKYFITLITVLFFMSECTIISPLEENPGNLNYFDIMTWNIEHFSQHENTTSTVISIIKDINPSIIAFQEIESIAGFDSIYNNIENYDGYRASSASYGLNLAYIWDTTIVKNAQFH